MARGRHPCAVIGPPRCPAATASLQLPTAVRNQAIWTPNPLRCASSSGVMALPWR